MTKFLGKPNEPPECDPGPGWLRSRFRFARWPRPDAQWRDHIETVATALTGAAKDEEDDAIRRA